MRRQAKADENQPAIVKAFRDFGCSVQHLHTIGKGCPDVLIGKGGQNFLIEIKNGKKHPSKKRLTKDEAKWHENWRGQVCVIESPLHAIEFITQTIKGKNDHEL